MLVSGLRQFLAVTVAASLLAGCSVLQEQLEGFRAETPAPSSEQPAAPVPAPKPDRPTRVAILLSNDAATYATIAQQITQRGPDNQYVTLNLKGETPTPDPVVTEFEGFAPDKIVAIGLHAAKVARTLSDRPLVFCQVFNYQDHGLLTPQSKGVKLLPPFSRQIEVWKNMTPNLRSIGLIAGPNQDDLLDEIKRAAAEHRVELLVRTVTTDKEALFEFKELTPQIQGFWLLPDNRILSPRVLREMLSYGKKHGNQTVVFNPQLLTLGADVSFTSSETDVANAVLNVLGGTGSKNLLFGPPMTSLTQLNAAVKPDFYAALRARGNLPDNLEQHSFDD